MHCLDQTTLGSFKIPHNGGYCTITPYSVGHSVLAENQQAGPSGSDSGELLEGLLEGARRRNLSNNSLTAYERTWTKFLAWAAAGICDPRSLSFLPPWKHTAF